MVEDSSEIASARVSLSYKKSMKRKKLKSKLQPVSIRTHSLSKIYEENYNSKAHQLEIKVNGCHVTFVCDDEKVTSDTSDSLNNNEGNMSYKKENSQSSTGTVIFESKKNDGSKNILWDETDNKASENMNKSFLLSRFVPEFIDSNKITIV